MCCPNSDLPPHFLFFLYHCTRRSLHCTLMHKHAQPLHLIKHRATPLSFTDMQAVRPEQLINLQPGKQEQVGESGREGFFFLSFFVEKRGQDNKGFPNDRQDIKDIVRVSKIAPVQFRDTKKKKIAFSPLSEHAENRKEKLTILPVPKKEDSPPDFLRIKKNIHITHSLCIHHLNICVM